MSHKHSKIGWAPWNLSWLELKFDDTRLSYWHKNKVSRIEIYLLLPDFANSLPCWLSQQNCASQQGRKLAKSGSNKFLFQFCQSYSYVNRKVWYHQILIPSNLGFLVLILLYILCLNIRRQISFPPTWSHENSHKRMWFAQ